MADSGKQSPLGVNVLGSLLGGHDINTPNNTTFYINPVAESYYGKSKNNAHYEPGKIVNDTCLKWITYALKEAWARTPMNGVSSEISAETYDAMLNIGQSRIPALGNSKPPTYQVDDPSEYWTESGGPANSGFAINGNVDHGQDASWDPWDSGDPAGSNPNSEVTKWGWVRAMALQAFNEFWWNASVGAGPGNNPDPANSDINYNPSYKDFTSYFLTADTFIDQSNKAIIAVQNAQTFLQGTFSNQDDLISADIAGISLSARAFGQDLINLGKALDLQGIGKFGLPSVLLQTLKTNNAITQSVILTLLVSGLSKSEIENISLGNTTPDKLVEQKIYAAFLLVKGQDLVDILTILNCKTRGLTSLADLVSVKKLFPLSYRTLTVPVYNTEPGPTNSKTYYLLFINDELNPQLVIPRIRETIGVIIPPEPPPVVVEPPPVPPPPEPPRIPEPEVIVIPQPPEVPIPPVVQPPQPPVIVPPGGGCPAPWTKITLADKSVIEASKIERGMYVYTKHENKGIWGTYKVTDKQNSNDDRWIVKFDDGREFVGTYNHRVLTENDWCEIRNLRSGDKIVTEQGFVTVTESSYFDHGEVVKITVEDAHTFLTEGFLSHNIKIVGGGGCVALESFVPLIETEQKHNGREITKAWMLESGMKISLGTDDLQIVDGQVVKTLNDYQPCVRIVTAAGVSLVCSTTAPIYTEENGFIPATQISEKHIAVMRGDRTWFDKVVSIEDVGMKFVRVIDAGNNSFWAGEKPGEFILHHNVPINENFDFDKK